MILGFEKICLWWAWRWRLGIQNLEAMGLRERFFEKVGGICGTYEFGDEMMMNGGNIIEGHINKILILLLKSLEVTNEIVCSV